MKRKQINPEWVNAPLTEYSHCMKVINTGPKPKRVLPRFRKFDYCPGCGMLRSQCDCWDGVNQP